MADRSHGDRRIPSPQPFLMFRNTEVVPIGQHPAVHVDAKTPCVRELGARAIEQCGEAFEMIREPYVIVRQICDVPASSFAHDDVAVGVPDTGRFRQVEPPDARIVEPDHHVTRLVGTSVPGDEQFEIRLRLPQRTTNSERQDVRAIVRGEYDRESGLCVPVGRHVLVLRRRKLPVPARPVNEPLSMMTRPREITVSVTPVTSRPS